MKRELKFRAWDEMNKVMHYDFQFIKSGDEGNDWIIFISDKFPLTEYKTNPFSNPNPYFAQQLKIMQFTELTDKNRKEIYEGDILKISSENSSGTVRKGIYEVDYFAGGFSMKRKSWDEIIRSHLGEFPNGNTEVIGNIYENENLIEAGEKL